MAVDNDRIGIILGLLISTISMSILGDNEDDDDDDSNFYGDDDHLIYDNGDDQ